METCKEVEASVIPPHGKTSVHILPVSLLPCFLLFKDARVGAVHALGSLLLHPTSRHLYLVQRPELIITQLASGYSEHIALWILV